MHTHHNRVVKALKLIRQLCWHEPPYTVMVRIAGVDLINHLHVKEPRSHTFIDMLYCTEPLWLVAMVPGRSLEVPVPHSSLFGHVSGIHKRKNGVSVYTRVVFRSPSSSCIGSKEINKWSPFKHSHMFMQHRYQNPVFYRQKV